MEKSAYLWRVVLKYDWRTAGCNLIITDQEKLSKACLFRFFLASVCDIPVALGHMAGCLSFQGLHGRREEEGQRVTFLGFILLQGRKVRVGFPSLPVA